MEDERKLGQTGDQGANGADSDPAQQAPWDRLEHALAEQLTGGPLEDRDQKKRLMAQISPKYEIRVQTELDPVVEETKQYRKMAQEIDDRYDRYDKQR